MLALLSFEVENITYITIFLNNFKEHDKGERSESFTEYFLSDIDNI